MNTAREDHADFSADALGVIGVSADKRFVFVRTCNETAPRPSRVYRVDFLCMEDVYMPFTMRPSPPVRPGFITHFDIE